jgi:hypothetical protein
MEQCLNAAFVSRIHVEQAKTFLFYLLLIFVISTKKAGFLC